MRSSTDLWQGLFQDSLGGLPPRKFLRLEAILRKYSGPRRAVFRPPLRPNSTAAGFFSGTGSTAGAFFFGMARNYSKQLLLSIGRQHSIQPVPKEAGQKSWLPPQTTSRE